MDHEEAKTSHAAERYILNELPEAESERFEEHYFNCQECAENVRYLAQIAEVIKEHPFAVKPLRATSWMQTFQDWWTRPMVGTIAFTALAWFMGLSAYQERELRVQSHAVTATGIVLLPESRGEVQTIVLKEQGKHALLQADLPGSTGVLRWELRPLAGGGGVAEGDAVAPRPGSCLNLIVPTANLALGEYVLAVRAAEGGQNWIFRFRVV